MNILIVDDHPLTCQGLAALLLATQAQAKVSSAYTVAQAQTVLERLPAPDWIFLDIYLPDDPEHRFFHALCSTQWIYRTVLISAELDQRLVRTALAAGARGFIPKTAEPDMVLQGFKAVLAGEFYVPGSVAHQLRLFAMDEPNQRSLSPRLRQVQDMLSRGAANKVIARELGLSAHTVKEYVSSVLTFHGVSSRMDLIVRLNASSRTKLP